MVVCIVDDTRIRYTESIVLPLEEIPGATRVQSVNALMKKHTLETDVIFAALPELDFKHSLRTRGASYEVRFDLLS